MPQGHGVSIIPKFGIVMPEDLYNEKMMKGQIGADGVEYTEEEVKRMSGVGEIQEPDNTTARQMEPPREIEQVAIVEDPIDTSSYVNASGMDWSKVENIT